MNSTEPAPRASGGDQIESSIDRWHIRAFVVLLGLIVMAAVLLALPEDRSGINVTNAQKIRRGQTFAEVKRIFGCSPNPPGFHDTYGVIGEAKREFWASDSVGVEVSFDLAGKVITHRWKAAGSRRPVYGK